MVCSFLLIGVFDYIVYILNYWVFLSFCEGYKVLVNVVFLFVDELIRKLLKYLVVGEVMDWVGIFLGLMVMNICIIK